MDNKEELNEKELIKSIIRKAKKVAPVTINRRFENRNLSREAAKKLFDKHKDNLQAGYRESGVRPRKLAQLYKQHGLTEMKKQKDPSEYDQEGDMMKNQLRQICSANQKLVKMVKDNDNLPEWVQSKVTKATDYITSVRDYLESENMNEETLNELYGKGKLGKIKDHWLKKADQKRNKRDRHRWADLRGNKPQPWDEKDAKTLKLADKNVERADTLIDRRDWKKKAKRLRATAQKYMNEETKDNPPFDPDKKKSTPWKNPSAKAKQLARQAMRKQKEKQSK